MPTRELKKRSLLLTRERCFENVYKTRSFKKDAVEEVEVGRHGECSGLESTEILQKQNKFKHVRTWTEKLTLHFKEGQSQCGAEIGGLLLVLSGVVAAVLIVLLQ